MKISTKEYLELTQKEIKDYDAFSVFDLDIIQVWYCKTIQNHKGLFIVKNRYTDHIFPYFIESTYNGDNGELYLDFYRKEDKQIIKVQ